MNMKKHRRAITVALLLAAVAFAVVVIVKWSEPTFRGKPESYWITNIIYRGPTEQIEQWQSFGPEGIRFLTEYLDRGTGGQDAYRKLYNRYAPKIPAVAQRALPAPVDNRSTRMCVSSLLSSLACQDTNAAIIAEPAIARMMSDENPSLRQLAVGAYECNILRAQINPGLKKARFNEFLRLAGDDHHWVRNNAARTLSYFADEAAAITPVLTKALPESDPRIELTIARILTRINREGAAKAGVAGIAASRLKNPDKGIGPFFGSRSTADTMREAADIARQAAEVLGELHAEPAVSVPALIEGLGSTNREVAIASFRALTQFTEQTEQTLPVLRKAAIERTDIPNSVKAELNRIDPATKVTR